MEETGKPPPSETQRTTADTDMITSVRPIETILWEVIGFQNSFGQRREFRSLEMGVTLPNIKTNCSIILYRP